MGSSNFRKPKRTSAGLPDLDAFVQGTQEDSPHEVEKTITSSKSVTREIRTKPTGVYFTHEQRRWLKLQALEQDSNVSDIVRQIVQSEIERKAK